MVDLHQHTCTRRLVVIKARFTKPSSPNMVAEHGLRCRMQCRVALQVREKLKPIENGTCGSQTRKSKLRERERETTWEPDESDETMSNMVLERLQQLRRWPAGPWSSTERSRRNCQMGRGNCPEPQWQARHEQVRCHECRRARTRNSSPSQKHWAAKIRSGHDRR